MFSDRKVPLRRNMELRGISSPESGRWFYFVPGGHTL